MSVLDNLTAMSVLLLRMRGQWRPGQTSADDIDMAVNGVADLTRGDDQPKLISKGLIDSAIEELKRRAT